MCEITLNCNLIEPANPANFTPSRNLGKTLKRLQQSGDKMFSVELCSNMPIDIVGLQQFNPLYYSTTWINKNNNVAMINAHAKYNVALPLAAALEHCGRGALLHLPVRYLKEEIVFEILTIAKRKGVRNILALQGETLSNAHIAQNSGDFRYAIDLIKFIRKKFGRHFYIAVTGYPEGHPRSQSQESDLEHLKAKIDAGADFIITQAFFNLDTFHKFYNNCRKIGITVPIVPGIIIINSYASLLRICKLCKFNASANFLNTIKRVNEDETAARNYGIYHCVNLIKGLLSHRGCPVANVHIFSLNNFNALSEICEQLQFSKIYIERPLPNSNK